MTADAMKSTTASTATLPPLNRICVLVEPSPFTYMCGYMNIFQGLLQYLHDDPNTSHVEVVTTEVVVQDKPHTWLGFPVHYTAGFRFPNYRIMSMSLDWTLKAGRVLWNMRPDIIHVSSPGFLCACCIIWSRLFRIPLCMSYHTNIPIYYRTTLKTPWLIALLEWGTWKYISWTHAFADLTLVVSPQSQQEFVDHGISRVEVWQKAVDTEMFHPRHRNAEMRLKMSNGNPDDFLIVYIGRLAFEKRLVDLLEVMPKMPQNTRLCIIGAGIAEQALQQQFAQEKRCLFLGKLSGLELSQAFASADCFCMPSDSETLGLVVLESMASGVPVVAADAGGIQDVIHDSKTGFLVEPGNADAFAERLLSLHNSKELRTTMARNARTEAERWTWAKAMAKLRHEQYLQAQENFGQRPSERLWRLVAGSNHGDHGKSKDL